MHLLTWPKRRQLMPADGYGWLVTIEPGRLVLTRPADGLRVEFTNPDELRSLAMQLHAAAIDRDLAVQAAAAKASADRRLARQHRGEPTGLRHRPFTEEPEPPLHAEVPA